MKTNRLFFLFFSLLLSIGMALGRTNIPLVRDVPKGGGEDDKARALFPSPTAYLDNNLLVISLFIPDPIKVSIIGEDNNLRRHLDFSSSDEFVIDLKEQGMHSGVYTLRFLHYSIWWQGVFTFEGNGDITPGTQTSGIAVEYIDSTYYQLEGENATIVAPSVAGKKSRSDSFSSLRDYPDCVVIPSEITHKDATYQVTSIGSYAFRWCYELVTATLPNTITTIGNSAFRDCHMLRRVNIPESVTRIGEGAFDNCLKLSDVVVPEGVNTIEANTFGNCINLSSVTLPSNLESIGSFAFNGCIALRSVEIPTSVTSIGEWAFSRCENLQSISFPEGLERIEKNTFCYCKSLTHIEIPENIRSIESWAFSEIPDTAHIYCYSKIPCRIRATAFNYNCTLHVPRGFKDKYRNTPNWGHFASIVDDILVEIKGGLTGFSPAVQDDEDEAPAYDLQGRPADGTQRGIIVRNGKKMMIK